MLSKVILYLLIEDSNNTEVPKFFCQTKPEDFSPQREEPDNSYLTNSQLLGKQGNAQVTILGLNKSNPF